MTDIERIIATIKDYQDKNLSLEDLQSYFQTLPLWFKTISSGIIGMPIYIKSKPDADFGKPSPASDVRLEDLLVKK